MMTGNGCIEPCRDNTEPTTAHRAVVEKMIAPLISDQLAGSRRQCSAWGQRNGKPQRFELTNSPALLLLRIAFEEVVSPQLGEDCFGLGQEAIDPDQEQMGALP